MMLCKGFRAWFRVSRVLGFRFIVEPKRWPLFVRLINLPSKSRHFKNIRNNHLNKLIITLKLNFKYFLGVSTTIDLTWQAIGIPKSSSLGPRERILKELLKFPGSYKSVSKVPLTPKKKSTLHFCKVPRFENVLSIGFLGPHPCVMGPWLGPQNPRRPTK
jgi:hypothetical protein